MLHGNKYFESLKIPSSSYIEIQCIVIQITVEEED